MMVLCKFAIVDALVDDRKCRFGASDCATMSVSTRPWGCDMFGCLL